MCECDPLGVIQVLLTALSNGCAAVNTHPDGLQAGLDVLRGVSRSIRRGLTRWAPVLLPELGETARADARQTSVLPPELQLRLATLALLPRRLHCRHPPAITDQMETSMPRLTVASHQLAVSWFHGHNTVRYMELMNL